MQSVRARPFPGHDRIDEIEYLEFQRFAVGYCGDMNVAMMIGRLEVRVGFAVDSRPEIASGKRALSRTAARHRTPASHRFRRW